MGEDETAVRNRVALICERCRLVNGQAPPGTKGLEEVGRWKCGGCGAMNGVESEARRMLALAHEEAGPVGRGAAASDPEPEPEHGEEKVADVTIET